MAKSNQSKSTKPAAKAEKSEAAPAKKETKPVASAKPVATASKPAATAAKGKKAAAKPTTTPGMAPMIDTSLAASTAAKLLVNRNMIQGRTGGEKPNSAGFRQMKEGLSKGVSPASIPFLPGSGSQKKNTQAFGTPNQVGHNQTFGADVNRAGVPRRTGGG